MFISSQAWAYHLLADIDFTLVTKCLSLENITQYIRLTFSTRHICFWCPHSIEMQHFYRVHQCINSQHWHSMTGTGCTESIQRVSPSCWRRQRVVRRFREIVIRQRSAARQHRQVLAAVSRRLPLKHRPRLYPPRYSEKRRFNEYSSSLLSKTDPWRAVRAWR